jgi:predicted HAD superfamily Cof-like phosphohydrolase
MTIFKDQDTFMTACDQEVGSYNADQYELYINLITEEVNELATAIEDNDEVEQLDALIDILVVVAGALHSFGVDANGAWNEVMTTNFAKVDQATGKVIKRADGKILKPANWVAPNLAPFLIR